MSERSLSFCSWWNRDWLSQYYIITFMCTVTSHRVGRGCTVWSFTTLGECGLSLSLGLRPMRLIIESGNVKGSKCKPKSYVARDDNTRTWLSRRLRVE